MIPLQHKCKYLGIRVKTHLFTSNKVGCNCPELNWCIQVETELFKYPTFWGERSPTRTLELYWSNPKSHPLFFCSFDPPCQLLLLSQSLFISRRLSHLYSPLLFFVFLFLCPTLPLQSSCRSPRFWYSQHLCPCLMRPCYVFSSPSASLSPPRFISHTLSLLLFFFTCVAWGREIKMCSWRNRASSLFTPHYYCFTQPHWGTRSTYCWWNESHKRTRAHEQQQSYT